MKKRGKHIADLGKHIADWGTRTSVFGDSLDAPVADTWRRYLKREWVKENMQLKGTMGPGGERTLNLMLRSLFGFCSIKNQEPSRA